MKLSYFISFACIYICIYKYKKFNYQKQDEYYTFKWTVLFRQNWTAKYLLLLEISSRKYKKKLDSETKKYFPFEKRCLRLEWPWNKLHVFYFNRNDQNFIKKWAQNSNLICVECVTKYIYTYIFKFCLIRFRRTHLTFSLEYYVLEIFQNSIAIPHITTFVFLKTFSKKKNSQNF